MDHFHCVARKPVTYSHVNNKFADHPAHLHHLTRSLVIHSQESIIDRFAMHKLSAFLLISATAKFDLSLTSGL